MSQATWLIMSRSFLIYVPTVLLLIGALLLPQAGHDLIGRMSAREFVMSLAFWWMVFAVGFRVVLSLIQDSASWGTRGTRF